MSAPVVPLTGLTGTVTLMPGVDFKVVDTDLTEDLRTDDGEGLADLGYSVPLRTGQKLMGTVKGFMTASDPGIANATASFQGVPFELAYNDTANTITGLCTVTKFRAGVKVGKNTTFECDFTSFGAYTRSFPVS